MTVYYHVTPAVNRNSIDKSGVRPDMSAGKRQASYWVDGAHVNWAIAHVALKHHRYIDDLWIYAVSIKQEELRLTNKLGLFYVRCVIYPTYGFTAARWVTQIEALR